MRRISLAALAVLSLTPALSHAATVLVSDAFNGSSSAYLNGRSADTNTISTATWNASTTTDTTFRADGSVAGTSSNVDVGAWLDLGGNPLTAHHTYNLTLAQSNLSNAVLYFGLTSVTSPSLTTRGQNQGALGVGIIVRNITGGIYVGAYSQISGTETVTKSTTLSYTAGAQYTAVINANNLTDATLTLGDATETFNATSLRQMFIAFEDNGTSTGTFDSISFTDVTPEPATGLMAMGGIGLAITRRVRRRSR